MHRWTSRINVDTEGPGLRSMIISQVLKVTQESDPSLEFRCLFRYHLLTNELLKTWFQWASPPLSSPALVLIHFQSLACINGPVLHTASKSLICSSHMLPAWIWTPFHSWLFHWWTSESCSIVSYPATCFFHLERLLSIHCKGHPRKRKNSHCCRSRYDSWKRPPEQSSSISYTQSLPFHPSALVVEWFILWSLLAMAVWLCGVLLFWHLISSQVLISPARAVWAAPVVFLWLSQRSQSKSVAWFSLAAQYHISWNTMCGWEKGRNVA